MELDTLQKLSASFYLKAKAYRTTASLHKEHNYKYGHGPEYYEKHIETYTKAWKSIAQIIEDISKLDD